MEFKKSSHTEPSEQKENLNLKEKVEQFKENSERLKFLISYIDRSIFPENPLSIEEEKLQKISSEGKIIFSKASHSFDTEGDNVINERYEIDKEELNKSDLSTADLFNIAIHEIRHRI